MDSLIHTAKFYLQLSQEELGLLCRKFGGYITLLSKVIDSNFKGITTTITNRFYKWWMFVDIDFIKLLGKPDINQEDIKE
ncbi:hypothetical protein, partial [Acinetobacter baumannii]|uniref:hypothetical protein n=1 Tax=Acinetobacter baumannii TaxID=470 RepID=UPI000B30A9D9